MSTRTGSALLVLTVAAFVLLVSFASAGTAPLTTINFTPAIPPAVRFLTPTIIPISTGQVPLSIATADLNGDGNVDIALRTEQGVQILLGNGKGGFTLGAFYALKQSVQGYDAITLADMNNDGIPDIVTTSLGGPSVVYIFLGNGDGTFKTPTSYTAIEPYAVAVGDFNGDGNLDVAVAQAGNDSIGVFLGNGNGTLQPEFNYAVSGGFHAETIAIGDLNGDGKLDIVSASQFINIFFGNGDGTFQTPVVLSAGASQVAVADVNNDGQPDIVFSIGAAVGVYLNKGGGTFTNYIVSQSTGLSGGFALADFNHDGNIDVILGSNGIMFGEGNGKFRATSTLYFGNTTTRVLADVNGDGILDVLQPYSNTGSGITLTFGAGGGALESPRIFPTAIDAFPQIVGADFNGDGKLDVASAEYDVLQIFPGNGNGTFQSPISAPDLPTPYPLGILAGDFNNDGKLDLVVLGEGYPEPTNFFLYLGNGDGTFQSPITITAPGYNNVAFAVADFNQDGNLDVAVLTQCINSVNCQNGLVTVMLGDGKGNFTAAASSDVNLSPVGLAAADFNNDHIPDLAVTSSDPKAASNLNVLLGKGDGTFGPQSPVHDGQNSEAQIAGLQVSDFNNDGNPDIAIGIAGTITVVLGKGNGAFGPPVATTGSTVGVPFCVADFNGDGIPDICNNVGDILLGNGNGSFQQPVTVIGTEAGVELPGLLGNDKLPDLIVGNNRGIGVYTNLGK